MARRTCGKKNRFASRQAAMNFARARIPARPSGEVPLQAYWCPEHKAWHFSTRQGPPRSGRRRVRGGGLP